jgi:hypothetical protein
MPRHMSLLHCAINSCIWLHFQGFSECHYMAFEFSFASYSFSLVMPVHIVWRMQTLKNHKSSSWLFCRVPHFRTTFYLCLFSISQRILGENQESKKSFYIRFDGIESVPSTNQSHLTPKRCNKNEYNGKIKVDQTKTPIHNAHAQLKR